MKLIVLSSLAVIALSCSNSKTEIVSDSTSVDSVGLTAAANTYGQTQVSIQNQAHDSPFANFSNYSESLSVDPTESEVTFGLQELMTEYDNRQYRTVESTYSRERDYEGEYQEVTETEEVTETWFFDASHQLKAFSRKYFREGEGRDTKILICLFSNDSLIALSDYWNEDNQIGMTYHTKILRSKCPDCGMDSNMEAGGSGGVKKYLNENDLVERESEFFTTLPDLISTIGNAWDKAIEATAGFVFTVEYDQWPDNQSGGKAYAQEFTISKELYNDYVSKRNLLNDFAKKPFTINSYASITNHLKKENIEFTDEIFNGQQSINFGESQIIVNENSKDPICSAYIESSKIPFSKNIKIGMKEEAFVKIMRLTKDDIVTDGQRYFEYTLQSEEQSRTITFTFEENILMAFKYEVSPCTVPTSDEQP